MIFYGLGCPSSGGPELDLKPGGLGLGGSSEGVFPSLEESRPLHDLNRLKLDKIEFLPLSGPR